jgi:outer membrane immunogenic protein
MLRTSIASGGNILAKNESRCVGCFKPLAAVSALALAGAVTVGAARAADIFDGRESRKGSPPAPRCALFHGFYLGAHAGTAFHDWSWNDRDAWAKKGWGERLPSTVSDTESGFIGGLQGGFNWQRGCTVFGFEADWSWADLDSTKGHTDGSSIASLTVKSDIDGFGTLRTRAGIVMDNLLLYVTGGLAFANVDRSWTLQNDDDDEVKSFKSSETRFGWAAGFGAEWALTDRITIKSETLWLRFDDDSFTAFNNNDNHNNHKDNDEERGARFDLQDNLFVARIGMNFKFDSGALYPRWWP